MDIESLTRPFWKGKTVENESVMMLSENDETPWAKLFFKPDEILSVQSSDLKREYIRGKDWEFKEGRIIRLPDSEMPYMKNEKLHFYEKNDDDCFSAKDGGYILYKTGGYFHKRQVGVTYTHSDSIDFDLYKADGDTLKKVRESLKNGLDLKICFYGDSITAGCDGSGAMNIEPHMPGWCDLVRLVLERKYECKIESFNTAVGGKQSDWGAENADERAAVYKPDLTVIAFGMNDGTEKTAPAMFKENIMKIKAGVRAKNPDTEFIFISTTLANSESVFDGLQREYYKELLKCADASDAVINMTKVHDMLLQRKRFVDMTGNNINHPNDFLIRIYAQAVLSLFL